MSACLFTLSPKTIFAFSDDQLNASILNWEQQITQMTVHTNKFLVDQASGVRVNLRWAAAEKYRRVTAPSWTQTDTEQYLLREGLYLHPALMMALADQMAGKSSILYFENFYLFHENEKK